ncbi:PVC-type heme-binding CxxCH protein [Candidatus Laterigemmans baculatus]|uniref:PVC-type heme-binding CxxCH protein n=1 Tax=Candidatus Laterigemmans baculatus TaxID=2770505 RepID=UPI0013DA0B2F|nr:PVC-type heme-binding CxxCH protein [Candidatus Laterigemmans baculatus]
MASTTYRRTRLTRGFATAALLTGVVLGFPHPQLLRLHASEATAGSAPQPETSAEAEPASAGAAEPGSPDEWYGAGVRPTEAWTPEEERAGFHLPPGFEVRLVAAEPEIKKPMNLSFDVRGRIWVTDTLEYPYPAPLGESGRDSVRILEDTNGDGHADSVTTFAEGLNIPIGILPYGDGCICYSIPNLWYLRDTDGDGKCDRRDLLLGPFDTSRDTHGMVNSLRAGDDGWIYACHGFNNQSRVAGSDGHEITLISGNTFRFLPDGSRVEHVTWGQVNPFGVAVDEWGYFYSADCHSKPISQLIRGGYYPSFGRPHDGLGFVPPMMGHLHGSTAIAGLAYFPADLGIDTVESHPLENHPLENQMLSGNVMTSRINRTEIHRSGATACGEPLSDFLTSDDPWFRPVDIRLGPDDCIYVADFYNRIIGHYEVPLDHPQRDRHRGRIWQIRRSGDVAGPRPLDDLTLLVNFDRFTDDAANVEKLTACLGDPNPERRNLALQAVANCQKREMRDAVAGLADNADASPMARVSALWCLYRWREIDPAVARRLAEAPSPQLRTHLQRMLGEWVSAPTAPPSKSGLAWIMELTTSGLEDTDANVARAAAEALGRAGSADSLDRLVARLMVTEPADPILRQTLRIAIRNVLAVSESHQRFLRDWRFTDASRPASSELAQIALAIDSEAAGRFLVTYLQWCGGEDPQAEAMMRHAASTLAVDDLRNLIALAQSLVDQADFDEANLLEQFTAARSAKEGSIAEPLRQWALELAQRKLGQVIRSRQSESPSRVHWRAEAEAAWPTETRRTLKGRPVMLASSFPLGETTTDVLQSETFAAPAEIEFWLAGHNGHPEEPDHRRNRIELIAAASGQVLHVAFPPRRDAVERIHWDCRDVEGQPVHIRCTDGDSASAYAWLAFGGFVPEQLEPSSEADPLTQSLRLVVQYDLQNLREQLGELAQGEPVSPQRSAAVAEAIARLDGNRRLAALLSMSDRLPWHELTAPLGFFRNWIEAAIAGERLDDAEQLRILCRTLSTSDQRQLARRFATHRETASLLIEGIEAGDVAPDVLMDKEVEAGLEAVASDAMHDQIAALRQRAQNTDAAVATAISRLVDQTLPRLASPPHDLELGRAVFTKQCAVCHQLGGQGQIVGPQLEGVGNRGAQRLLEDILQPDLNVDQAFRTTTVLTIDGAVVTGLVRNVSETETVLTAADGKITTIPNAAIEVQREGTTSLMPGNLHEALTAEELAAVVAYLQQQARRD